MKNLLKFMFIFVCVSANAQIEVELFFKNACADTIKQIEFDLTNLNDTSISYYSKNSKVFVPFPGTYLISAYKTDGKTRDTFYENLEITNSQKVIDTLLFPKIFTKAGSELHSTYFKYYNCNKLCNGYESNYYENGKLRLAGFFKNGNPIKYSEYRYDGTKRVQTIYKRKKTITKLFDETGKLDEIEVRTVKKNRIIIKKYDSSKKLLYQEAI